MAILPSCHWSWEADGMGKMGSGGGSSGSTVKDKEEEKYDDDDK